MVSEEIFFQIFIVIVLFGLSLFISHTFFEIKLEIVLIVLGLLLSISAILEVIDPFYYSVAIIVFIISAYRFSNDKKV